ncbi:MAG: spore germination protein [Oscillospiraceae bacterium]
MLNWIKKKIDDITMPDTMLSEEDRDKKKVSKSINYNVNYVKSKLGESFDIVYKSSEIDGSKAMFIMADGMCNNLLVTQQVVRPVLENKNYPSDAGEKMKYIRDEVAAGIDQKETDELDEVIKNIVSGLVILFIDGVSFCECFGVQGFPKRSISDSKTEVQERGGHEAFIESFKDNVALIRKRIRSPYLRFEIEEVGKTSMTRICICYMEDRVSKDILKSVKKNIKKAELDVVLGTGYLRPFLDSDNTSIFSSVGTTERPDVACAEIAEGRVVVIIDGTPFALIAPYLFVENFHSMDDYNYRPFYATFCRGLRYISFFISMFLPGIYVAICTFHQEMLPTAMIYDMAVSESITPMPVMVEAIIIHIVYEIVREAGLRMPKEIGPAVSIVGALVIGDAAVNAGFIAAPMVIIVALTAISAFVVSKIHQPIAVLRFLFMIIGGYAGFYGLVLSFGAILINICSMGVYKTPFMAPIAPFSFGGLRDGFIRVSWKILGKREMQIQKMNK